MRNEVEPLLGSFVQGVSKHLEILESDDGDNDEELENWEMHAELVCIKWQHCLELWKIER